MWNLKIWWCHNNKTKHNKTWCWSYGTYCSYLSSRWNVNELILMYWHSRHDAICHQYGCRYVALGRLISMSILAIVVYICSLCTYHSAKMPWEVCHDEFPLQSFPCVWNQFHKRFKSSQLRCYWHYICFNVLYWRSNHEKPLLKKFHITGSGWQGAFSIGLVLLVARSRYYIQQVHFSHIYYAVFSDMIFTVDCFVIEKC